MAGLIFHSAHVFGIACQARDAAIAIQAENPEAMVDEAITAIVMATISAEAFINELMEMVQISVSSPWKDHQQHDPRLVAFAEALREIEESRGTLMLKYQVASHILSGEMFKKGVAPYQDFKLLISLRNDIVHLKPKDVFDEHPDNPLRITPPNYIEVMQRRGIARPKKPGVNISWFNIVQHAETAKWACDSALQIIAAILRFMPDGDLDPSRPMKFVFSKWIAK